MFIAFTLATSLTFAPSFVGAPVDAGEERYGSNASSTHIQKQVENYFDDIPVMADIAWCETKFKHFDKYGNVLRGELTPKDVGVMQINEYYWSESAEKMGLNLHNFADNMAFARFLHGRYGTKPWKSSAHCWKNIDAYIAQK